jgi:cobyrinic acid a,c-diamide synthase
MVAGTRSGCGKTSVSLGLMAAMAEAGIRVQPYKAGPDFIDPGHHQAVTGVPSHNLDGWMLDPETVRNIFARHLHGSDVGIVEGAMGLFDGFSGTTEQGSAGQLAKILDIPVILVVDARGMGRSAAAEVKGYVTFDPDITFAGIIFNNVASPRHEALLREAGHGP